MDQSFMDPPELILDRFRLEVLHLKALCVLYRPFLGRSDSGQEHKRCLDASEELVRIAIPLVEAGLPGGQLANCVVFIRRHVHDFNLAAMLLCSELKRQSTSGSLPGHNDLADRVRPMLLQGCGLWSLSGVTSPKARHVIIAIEKFLRQDQSAAEMSALLAQRASTTQKDTTAPTVTSAALSGIPNETSLVTDGGAPFSEALGDFQSTFNIEEDPLFQDLFGPTYSMTDSYQTIWP